MKPTSRTESKPNLFKFILFFFIIMAITDGNGLGLAIPLLVFFSIFSSHKNRSQHRGVPSRQKPTARPVAPQKKRAKPISKREMKKKYSKSHPIKMQSKRVSHNDDWFDTRSWESDDRPDAWADVYEPLNKKKRRRYTRRQK